MELTQNGSRTHLQSSLRATQIPSNCNREGGLPLTYISGTEDDDRALEYIGTQQEQTTATTPTLSTTQAAELGPSNTARNKVEDAPIIGNFYGEYNTTGHIQIPRFVEQVHIRHGMVTQSIDSEELTEDNRTTNIVLPVRAEESVGREEDVAWHRRLLLTILIIMVFVLIAVIVGIVVIMRSFENGSIPNEDVFPTTDDMPTTSTAPPTISPDN